MLASISSSQFTEWMAFDEIDPIGERRADLRNAMVMRMHISMNTPKGKTPPTIHELMPFEPEQPSQDESWKKIQNALRGMRKKKAQKG